MKEGWEGRDVSIHGGLSLFLQKRFGVPEQRETSLVLLNENMHHFEKSYFCFDERLF